MTANKGKFASDVLLLTLGSFMAQVISVTAAPVMVRFFSPQAFGVAMLFTSITGVIGVAVCLRYDRSIIVPKEDQDALYLVEGSFVAVSLFTILSVLFVLFARDLLARWLKAPELASYLWLLPVYVFFYGSLAALNSWTTRKKKFGLITLIQIVSVVCYVGGSLAAGIMHHRTGFYLIVTTVVGVVFSAAIMFSQIRAEYRGWWRRHNAQHLLAVLKRYARFPKYSIASSLISSFSTEMPTFFLSGFFSTSVVGQYALCTRLIRLPMGLIGTNIARVFSQSAAEAKYDGRLPKLVETIFGYLVALGMFPFLVLCVVGKDLFVLFFGQRWADAGVYAQILGVWAFFWFLSTSLSVVLDIVEEQAFELRSNLLIFVSRSISLTVGCLMRDPRIALGLFAVTDSMVYIYYSFAIMRRCAVGLGAMARVLAWHFLVFVPAGLILFGLRFVGMSPIVCVASSIALIGIYYAALLRTDPQIREVVRALLRKLVPKIHARAEA